MRLTAQQRRDRELADAILTYEVTIVFGGGDNVRHYRTLAKGARDDVHRDAQIFGKHLGGDSVTVVRQAQRYIFDRDRGSESLERAVTLNASLRAYVRETDAPPLFPRGVTRDACDA